MNGENRQGEAAGRGHLKSVKELFERDIFIAACEYGAVGDLDWEWEDDREDAERRVKEYMCTLTEWVRGQGGMVGSLKASVEDGCRGSVLSMNRDVVEREAYGRKQIRIRMTAVVFFVSGPVLKEKMKELRQRILPAGDHNKRP